MKRPILSSLLMTCLLIAAVPASAQRMLRCAEDRNCTIRCFQSGLPGAADAFQREHVDTLQIDITSRVIKLEYREAENDPPDFFILGEAMSCVIEDMLGIHD